MKFVVYIYLAVTLFNSGIINPVDNKNSDFEIYVVKYRWHTGIIVNRAEANPFLPLLKNEFISNQYIEIGWGERDFYMATDETTLLALKAVLVPNESVIHVHGFNENPEWYFRDNEIVKLTLDSKNYIKLLESINSSFTITTENKIINEGPGLVKNSFFYLSNDKYHLFRTCNVWIASKLKDAGIKINPFFAITSRNLINQLKTKSRK
jgi:uncharacterized protein (TIGR02117 family)